MECFSEKALLYKSFWANKIYHKERAFFFICFLVFVLSAIGYWHKEKEVGAMEKFLAIKCSSCSGAMYSDQKTASYICPFCGASAPWTEENFYRELPITFRHKPVERIDGLIKLGQVEVMSSVDPHDERLLSQRYRLNSVAVIEIGRASCRERV